MFLWGDLIGPSKKKNFEEVKKLLRVLERSKKELSEEIGKNKL